MVVDSNIMSEKKEIFELILMPVHQQNRKVSTLIGRPYKVRRNLSHAAEQGKPKPNFVASRYLCSRW